MSKSSLPTSAYVLREYSPGLDDAMILDPWRRQLISQRDPRLSPAAYGKLNWYMETVVASILDRAKTILAVSSQNDTHMFAFACCEEIDGSKVVHFAYTRKRWRQRGLARLLITATLGTEGPFLLSNSTGSGKAAHDIKKALCLIDAPHMAQGILI